MLHTKAARPKIGIVSNSTDCTYNFRLGLIQRLREEGAEVIVISPRDSYSSRLLAMGIPFVDLPLQLYSTSLAKEWQVFRYLYRVYRKHRFDFIIHYTVKPNIYGTLAAALQGVPSIGVTTGLGMLRDPGRPLAKRLLFSMYRFAALFMKSLWFLNEDDRQLFMERGIISAKRAFLLPGEGVNITEYQPRASQARRQHHSLELLYAGRIIWSKGIGELIEAARHFKDTGQPVRISLLGFVVPDHPEAIAYDQVRQWQDEGLIEYLGETDDIRPFLETTDAVVLPSYQEGMSRFLLEAASMAKPIIASDTMGCREVVEHGHNGLLCRPRSAEDLIEKIEQFLQLSLQERELMGIAGRKKVIAQFDEQLIVEHYMNALREHLPILRQQQHQPNKPLQ